MKSLLIKSVKAVKSYNELLKESIEINKKEYVGYIDMVEKLRVCRATTYVTTGTKAERTAANIYLMIPYDKHPILSITSAYALTFVSIKDRGLVGHIKKEFSYISSGMVIAGGFIFDNLKDIKKKG